MWKSHKNLKSLFYSHFSNCLHLSSHCLTSTPAKIFSHNRSETSTVFEWLCFVSSQFQGFTRNKHLCTIPSSKTQKHNTNLRNTLVMSLELILWKTSHDTFNYGLGPAHKMLKTKHSFESYLSHQMGVIIFN